MSRRGRLALPAVMVAMVVVVVGAVLVTGLYRVGFEQQDELSLRRTARRILERADFQVLEAETGAEALELLQEEEPPVSLVLTDIVMPRVGGLELHRRSRDLGLDMPFLFMSGYSADELDGRDLSEIQHFVRKPWTAVELIRWVGKAMGEGGSR